MKGYCFLYGLLVCVLVACEPIAPEIVPQEPQDTTVFPIDTIVETPLSFPRKHLLEEFSGQECIYCPNGMDCVHQLIDNDTNWIVLLHHYGYKEDHFSVPGSKDITQRLGVSSAPNITIDRAVTQLGDTAETCFPPTEWTSIRKTDLVDTTFVSVVLENTFDAASRMLSVTVTGQVLTDEYPTLALTVVLKESGMVDFQADERTFEGWQEFRHANAVRAYLSAPLGDVLSIKEHTYSVQYGLQLDEEWIAENCAVVAFVSADFQPVLQAEQQPVVAGTTGGADILHGGITPVPVPDWFPEPGADISPIVYTGSSMVIMDVAQASYTTLENGTREWHIKTYNTTSTARVNGVYCMPYADIFLYTLADETFIPNATYTINHTREQGSVYAGFRDDELMQIGGSRLYYINKSYFQAGYFALEAQWLLADGTLTVYETGWMLSGHAKNGLSLMIYGSTSIQTNN